MRRFVAILRATLALVLALVLDLAANATNTAPAATPEVDIADGTPGAAGARVPPNLLLNLSLGYTAAGAAYPGADDYARGKEYAGYFDARMCYVYPLRRKAGGISMEPDLNEATAYFTVSKAASASHECGADSFSGNFMNWAGAATLDILRYALSGGDRVIDKPGLTVLQRAYLPDGKRNPDFYAHPRYFPRKVLRAGGAGGAPNQVTPFDTAVLYVVSCRNRILFSDSPDGGNCDTPRIPADPGAPGHGDRFFGEFLARVKVCDTAEGPRRPDLCVAYANAYKPAGSLQQYAGKMRFGLFAYLTEHGAGDPNLYGGALRAALGHIGQSRYEAPDFSASVNDRPEWNGASGVLTGGAGVLNYVNLLGRSAPGRLGVYKNAEPLSELYYEALRYLQGRQPSAGKPGFASDDGLPMLGAWRDPLAASCQRDVILTVGDAYTDGDRYVPGNTRTDHADAARAPDAFGPLAPLNAMEWTRRLGDMEADPAGAHGNGAPRPGLRGLERQDTGAAGRGTYYIAGLAYWAHTNAIRADGAARVDNYVIDLDPGAGAGAGALDPRDRQLYLAAKYGGFDGNPLGANGEAGARPVLADAEPGGADGYPAHYALGGDPAALIAAIRAMFAGAAAGPDLQPGPFLMTTPVAAEDGYLFQADFSAAARRGGLSRFAVEMDGEGLPRIGKRLWEAGAILGGQPGAKPTVPAARHVYTFGAADGKPATISFEWAQLSARQRALLDLPPGPGEAGARRADGLGEARLNYLRGDRSREMGRAGGIFRRRDGVLGDIVHAAPVFVGAPSAGLQGPAYDAFYARHKNRRQVVYVGANDGMLHAFDAAGGAELFAYVPNALMGALNELTGVRGAHRAYVDGAAAAGEALLPGGWKTVLVSGMGAGARGVFALDVSEPDHFQAGGALWEFTDRDDVAMGNLLAAPAIAKFKTGVKDGLPQYRYFAVLTSGLNSHVGALFLLALDKPAAQAWRLGVNYYRLALPAGDPGTANAIGPPALALGGDGAVRHAYAGDLQGNLWRVDFGGGAPWPGAVERHALFVARDGAGAHQPISAQPKLAFAPGGGYLILFGTGKFIEDGDALPANFRQQSFYAIRDGLADQSVPAGRAALTPRTLSGAGGAAGLAVGGAAFSYAGAGARQGWYFDFPHTDGERGIGNPVLAAGKLFFNSLAPGRDPCAGPRTRAYIVDSLSGYAVDETGLAQAGAVTGKILDAGSAGPPLVFRVKARAGARNATGRALVTEEYVVLAPGGGVRKATLSMPAKRLGWREVTNWRELHAASTK
ncbi:MAG TPA: pilus assembly protein PilY [Janthinobacterium sp.]|nr:pilus assembly protein PilY [Janthinobacterium sp.]